MSRSNTLRLILIAACAWPWWGCFGPLAKRLADKETYGILAEKQQQAFGKAKDFSIDPTTTTLTSEVVKKAGFSSNQFTTTGLTIGLSDTLALAIDNNHDYKTRLEQVYLVALTLTEARHKFSPIFSGNVAARAVRRPSDVSRENSPIERFGEVASNLAVTKVFATGARVTVGLTNNFLKFYTGTRPEAATGLLAASVVQPLLQGVGTLVAQEDLIQADRNVIYQLRSFDRYQHRFIVDRMTQYYRLLQSANTTENEYQAYQRLIIARERAQAMEEAQRMAAFQVDQARQQEIQARNRWLIARTDYAELLDKFKLDLGMPPELNIQPDKAELAKLGKMEMVELKLDLPSAEREAVNCRLDYKTALDRAADAERDVRIAENSLLPAVNARANLALPSDPKNRPFDLEWRNRTYSGGLDVELPLDRKAERNDYRRALIDLEQSRRDTEQLRNSLIAEVRSAYHDVDQARQSYAIQQAGLRLAERRSDNMTMLMQVGRENVSMRDQLDAENSLRDARNSVTRVLVDYVVARLNFYYSIEALEINERGIPNHES